MSAGRPLQVLAHVHLYPPSHCAGAEMMLHAMLRWLLRSGAAEHADVITTRPPRRRDTYQGVRVALVRDPRRAAMAYRKADAVITHLDATRAAMMAARRTKTPLVHLVHNDRQLAFHGVRPDQADLVVFNSEWIARDSGWTGPAMVLHPPVWAADYPPTEGPHDAVMLMNLAPAKGSGVFYELARRMPDTKFLAVRGAYAHQVPPPDDLPNVELIGNTPQVQQLYARARVVLMPSTYESWGRVAVEAACSGVPCVASPTPGLLETGVPAAFCEAEPADMDAWEREVRRLVESDTAHAEAAERGRARALDLDSLSQVQMESLAAKLTNLAQ